MFNFLKKRKSNRIIAQVRDNYNTIAFHFSETRKNVWPEFELYNDLIKNDQNILDWGCGSGRFLRFVKNKKIRYFGVDISSGLLKEAKKEFSREIESGKAYFTCSDSEDLEFPKDFFDVVFMIASFHHLPDDETRLKLLQEVFEKMKKNGKLVISVWNLKNDWAKKKLKTPGWKKMGENDYLVPWKDQKGKILAKRYYHGFSKVELVDLLKKTGFKVLDLKLLKHYEYLDDPNGKNLIVVAEKK